MRHRYTTILLTTRRLHPRDRAVLAIVVVCLTLFAAGLAVGSRPAEPAIEPHIADQRPFYIIITSTPAATRTEQPTSEPVVIFQTVEVPIVVEHYVQAAPRAEPAPEVAEQPPEAAPPPEPTATQLPPLVVGETLAEYFARTGITPETVR